MPIYAPDYLATTTGGHWTSRPGEPLTGFNFDTRALRTGEVFVALKTDHRDGHSFLAEARQAGAGAALVAVPDAKVALAQLVVPDPLAAWQQVARAQRRAFAGPVVGISGSAGKTSTKDLLALLLGGPAAGVHASEGNFNNHIGVPLTLTRLDPARHLVAVIEAGISEPGEMAVLAGMISPDFAIITLIAPAHTAGLGGLDGVAAEKAVLPAALRPGGRAIFSGTTAELPAFRALDVPALVVERAEVLRPANPPRDRVYFAVSHRGERTAVSLATGTDAPVVYAFSRVSDGVAQNAVLAICAALRLGVAPALIQQRIAGWKPGKLRGEIRRIDGRLFYVDCYNANPASMADALGAFHAIAPADAPRLYVLGSMEELGTDSPALHRALGRSLTLRPDDFVFAIGSQANALCAGVLETGDFTHQLQMTETLEPVAATLAGWRGSVFIKGSRRYRLERLLEPSASLSLPC